MLSPVVQRFLISTSECNNCDETNHYYYAFHKDGSVTVEYEGCGGYRGRAAECHGEVVPREKAIEMLDRRLDGLRRSQERLENEILEFEMFLYVSSEG